jgi:hypothetical protein
MKTDLRPFERKYRDERVRAISSKRLARNFLSFRAMSASFEGIFQANTQDPPATTLGLAPRNKKRIPASVSLGGDKSARRRLDVPEAIPFDSSLSPTRHTIRCVRTRTGCVMRSISGPRRN